MDSHPPLPGDVARCHAVLLALVSPESDSGVSPEAIAWRRAVVDNLKRVGFVKPDVLEVRHA